MLVHNCSGLIQAAYRAAGYQGVARTTYQQIHQGVRVDPGNLQPGDLVFSSAHHVGLYVGNGMIISAPHTGAVVHRIPLQDFGGVYEARRLVNGGGGVRAPAVPGPNPALHAQLLLAAPKAPLAATTPQQVLSKVSAPSTVGVQGGSQVFSPSQPVAQTALATNPTATLDALARRLRAGG